MKMFIMAIVALASVSASAELTTVTVCNGGESGTECRTVTYNVRPHVDVAAPFEACSAEGTPCVPAAYGIPSWLQKLNDQFAGHAAVDQTEQYQNAGGGN